jgi:hypothetical protein
MAIDRDYRVGIAFAWLVFLRVAHGANLVPNTPQGNEIVPVDQPYNITWDPDDAPSAATVSIDLKNNDGPASLLTSILNFYLTPLLLFPSLSSCDESQSLIKGLIKPARV